MPFDLFVPMALGVILSLIIVNDLRRMRIPNMLSLVLLALFPLHALGFDSWQAVGYQIAFAVLVFVFGFAAFAVRAMGGGDVKIMAALALFAPLGYLAEIFLVFALCIFVSLAFVIGSRRIMPTTPDGWVYLSSKRFPLGLPIGLSGLVVLSVALRQLV